MTSKKPGTVYLVGAGPGDPGLITVKGAECLKNADVIFYDYLVNPEILKKASSNTKLVDVGKRHKAPRVSQEEIEKMMVSEARKGKTVVRLKGGDPFVFGRGGEEALFLHEGGIPFAIVPGVSSITAVAAYAGIPLTHRNFTADIAIITGHEDPLKSGEGAVSWEGAAKMGTIVLLMALGNLRPNLQKLIEYGKSPDTPAALISWGSYPYQKTIVGTVGNLANLAEKEKVGPPSVILIGRVVLLREKLKWFETKILFNKRILITRSREQASELSEKFQKLGAHVIEFPTIKIAPPKSWAPLDKAIKNISRYQWIIFTSINSVDNFWSRLKKLKMDVRNCAQPQCGHLKIAAIGPATKDRILSHGLWVDCLPTSYHSKGLAAALKKSGIKRKKGQKILFPQARAGNDELILELKKLGCCVERVEAYQTLLPRLSPEKIKNIFEEQTPDWITFASSSSVDNFVKIIGHKCLTNLLSQTKIACIGPVTRTTAISYGMKVDVMPRQATLDSLVEAIALNVAKG